MTCIHDYVIAYTLTGVGCDCSPIMWACSDCLEKFVPMSQLLAEVSAEREACAEVVKDYLTAARFDHRHIALGDVRLTIGDQQDFEAAIRARGNDET